MDLDRTVRKELATPAVVHFVVQYGLRHYASNSRATNDAVCAVLTRLVAPQVILVSLLNCGLARQGKGSHQWSHLGLDLSHSPTHVIWVYCCAEIFL